MGWTAGILLYSTLLLASVVETAKMSASSRPHSPKVCACGDAKSLDGRHHARRQGVSPTRSDAFRYVPSDPNVLGLRLLTRSQEAGARTGPGSAGLSPVLWVRSTNATLKSQVPHIILLKSVKGTRLLLHGRVKRKSHLQPDSSLMRCLIAN